MEKDRMKYLLENFLAMIENHIELKYENESRVTRMHDIFRVYDQLGDILSRFSDAIDDKYGWHSDRISKVKYSTLLNLLEKCLEQRKEE